MLLVIFCGGQAAAAGFRNDEFGFAFGGPGRGWRPLPAQAARGGGLEHRFQQGEDEDSRVNLIVWDLQRTFELDALCDSELRQMEARGEVSQVAGESRRVSGRPAASVRYLLEPSGSEPPLVIDATCFQTERFLGRLAATSWRTCWSTATWWSL